MVQKLIKIGTSTGLIVPKKQLDELDLRAGDEIDFTISKRASNTVKHSQLLKDLEGFMNTYDQDLQNLAKR